jgi:threonyl-tRNA synthetase
MINITKWQTPNEEVGLSYISKDYDPALYRVRHSVAHVLAQAVTELFKSSGVVHITIGPPIEDGFYYDFDLPRAITPEDLTWLERRMWEIIAEGHTFEYTTADVDEAVRLVGDNPYKRELIEDLAKKDSEVLSFFRHGDFVDLCRGPHIKSLKDIQPNSFKLLSVAGSYWRGSEKNASLQRVYGTAWLTESDLKNYLELRGEAEKRDHRKIGKELELFHFDQTAPGMPYWLPKGLKVMNTLLEYWRDYHDRAGYQEIASPLFNEKKLYEISGHWEHYRDDMFITPIDEHSTYCLKPMNCPNAMVVYNLKIRSYKDLPLRLSDCDILHRNERAGTMHGLLRVQKFTQDDAHIFITDDQIEEEYERIFKIAYDFYSLFNLKYKFRLGTRPEDFMGDPELWDRAESSLKKILVKSVGEVNFTIKEGDGAFYGPKIDIVMEDALGRSWQMGTIQLDFQLPLRFNCTYIGSDGNKHTPAVIHRVIYGSLERFLGILIESTVGSFPTWLAPVQVKILTISEEQEPYAEQLVSELRDLRIRVELDRSNDRLSAKIRNGQLEKVPYLVVIGKKEVESGKVSVRYRSKELGSFLISDLKDQVLDKIKSYTYDVN